MNIFQRILSHRKKIREQQICEIIGKFQEQNTITVDTIAHKVEGNIMQHLTSIVPTMDARIWKSEENIIQNLASVVSTMDARIWKSEENIVQNLVSVASTMDARIWKAEGNILQETCEAKQEVHNHIDFTYHDIMVVLQKCLKFASTKQVSLQTSYPIAYESNDHLVPHGTIRDNTRYPRFIKKCEDIFSGKDELSFLDLGCSGGGMVLEAALRGHFAMGLEGSDISLRTQRAEWRLLQENLKTCDVTKPFILKGENETPYQFDVITAWEVMEHIQEQDLPQLFENIKTHLLPTGYFVASIANWDDIDPDTGVNWHVTVKPQQWWIEQVQKHGFTVKTELLSVYDLARGGINPPQCYESPSAGPVDSERSFFLVLHK